MALVVILFEVLVALAGSWYYGPWFWVPLVILAILGTVFGLWVKAHPEQFVRACESFGSGYLDRVDRAADAWRTRHVVTQGPRLSDDPRYAAMRAGQERHSDNEEFASSPR